MPPASRGWISLLRVELLVRTRDPLYKRVGAVFGSPRPFASVATPQKIQLRKYQEECIQAVMSSLEQGHKRLGISLATGSGKTVIFTQLIDRVKPHSDTAWQTLILAHRQELVEQAARHCSNAYPDKTVDIEMGSLHASGQADITVASLQSIVSGDRMAKFDPSTFKLVLVDEAHHIVSPGYMKTLKYFGLSHAHPDSPALVGVSATLSRFDGLRIGAAIDQIVYHKDYIDMIGEKWLSDVCFTTVQSTADISKVKKGASDDFQTGELSKAVNTNSVNDITVRSWLAKASDRKSTLVFCCDIAHVVGLTNTFRAHGIEAQFVTGNTPKVERSARLDSFKRGEFKVLVNCGVFTEGTDIPNIDCVLLARPTKSRNLLVQMIGRGMRLHAGKKDCHIIDMVASLETGIVCTPTLFGLDPSELLDEATVEDMEKIKERSKLQEEMDAAAERNMKADLAAQSGTGRGISQHVTFTDYDSVFDLVEDTSGERHIRAISQHAWVCVDEDRYILANSSGTYLKIDRDPDDRSKFLITETAVLVKTSDTNSKSPYMRPRKIGSCVTLTDAVHAADTYAAKKYPRQFIQKNMPWRGRPATEGQLNFLNKLRFQDDQLTADALTKGKAGDMITKLKHGAKSRFSALEANRKKLQKAKLRAEELKGRESVSLGPVLS